MQETNVLTAVLIIKKLKSILKLKTDLQLAEFLNVRPNTISTWKKRNSVDYNSIIAICDLYEIDLNQVFLAAKRSSGTFSNSDTPLICREVQFQYCTNKESLMESLPRYNFPFIRGAETRAFQVLSTNMSPVIEENTYVICELTHLDEVADNSLVVVISPVKGLFINRIERHKEKPNYFTLSNENTFFSPISLNSADISEIWQIKATFSYKMNNENHGHFKEVKQTNPESSIAQSNN